MWTLNDCDVNSQTCFSSLSAHGVMSEMMNTILICEVFKIITTL